MLTEEESTYINVMCRLYGEIKFCPAERNGKVIESELRSWIEEFMILLEKNDQKSLFSYYIGKMLSYSPAGKDGYYPCEAVRNVLEDYADDALISGYVTEKYNSRGIYSPSDGRTEKSLAARYKENADYLSTIYPKTAKIYYRLCDRYKYEAKWEREKGRKWCVLNQDTFTDLLRTSNFPQNWTIYYWAYWMVWCVAAPSFIGSISRGRIVRQTILGGYIFGVGSTLTSFIVLGNYSMGMQVTEKADFIAQYLESGDLYGMIVSIIKTMPGAPIIMVVVLLTMIAFYATSFDSIALTASCYSYHTLKDGEQPNKGIQLMWCILLILLPIALLFAESSMNNLQSVSIVAAFPIGAVIVMIAVSFMKDAKNIWKIWKKKGQQEVDNVK